MQTKRPNNINELRESLLDAYTMLANDPKRVIQVGELANTAGKIIASVKVELEHAAIRKEAPSIPFLTYPKAIEIAPAAKQIT